MKQLFATVCAAIALAASVPAFAQSQKMMTPSMEQCKGGYKADYQKSMHWSKTTFNQACDKMMKK